MGKGRAKLAVNMRRDGVNGCRTPLAVEKKNSLDAVRRRRSSLQSLAVMVVCGKESKGRTEIYYFSR